MVLSIAKADACYDGRQNREEFVPLLRDKEDGMIADGRAMIARLSMSTNV